FASFYTTRGRAMPSFVVAIALGMAGHTLFAPVVGNPQVLASLVIASAALILFSGGLDMPLAHFLRRFVKIALLAFPCVILTGMAILTAYAALASADTALFLARQVGFGALFGVGGYLLLRLLAHMKRGHAAHYGADLVFFLATPILAFVGAAAFGGSGFLAAFV